MSIYVGYKPYSNFHMMPQVVVVYIIILSGKQPNTNTLYFLHVLSLKRISESDFKSMEYNRTHAVKRTGDRADIGRMELGIRQFSMGIVLPNEIGIYIEFENC